MVLFRGTGSPWFTKWTNRDHEAEKSAPFATNYLRDPQGPAPEPELKQTKIIAFMTIPCPAPVG